MMEQQIAAMPETCPACSGELEVTRLQCSRCGTEVSGRFTSVGLLNLQEPYASVLEMFLRLRGNVKQMERELGLSYPTVRARLEEAFAAAGLERDVQTLEADEGRLRADEQKTSRLEIVQAVNRGELSPAEGAQQLRELKVRRQT